MPVLDIAGQQQNVNMFGAYQQGKAMRIAEQNEARKMQIEEERLKRERETYAFNMSRAKESDQRASDLHNVKMNEAFTKQRIAAANDPIVEDFLVRAAQGEDLTEEYHEYIDNNYSLLAKFADEKTGGARQPLTPEHAIAGFLEMRRVRDSMPQGDATKYQELVSAYQVLADPNSTPEQRKAAAVITDTAEKGTEFAPDRTENKVKDEDSPTGWSWRSADGTLIPGAPAPSGMNVKVNPDGTVELSTGPGLTTTGARTDAQKRLRGVEATYSSISGLQKQLDSGVLKEALTVGGRLETILDVAEEKVFGTLSPQERARLIKVQTFMADSMTIYSSYLNEKGGKTLTKTEKETYKSLLPQSGETWADMDWDSITQFETNLNRLQELTERGLVREYLVSTNQGLTALSPEQLADAFPTNGAAYKIARATMFAEQAGTDKSIDPSGWVNIDDMSDEELAIYLDALRAQDEADRDAE